MSDDEQQLPLDLEAFYLNRQEVYHHYVITQLGDRDRAEELVHQVFLQIYDAWDDLLLESNLEEQVWAALRQAVDADLKRRQQRPALITASVKALRASQTSMKYVESRIGLYEAMAELPARQYDVVVLRHMIGYDTRTISHVLGLDERTVDYHCRKAKERLRVQLGIPAPPKKADKEGARK